MSNTIAKTIPEQLTEALASVGKFQGQVTDLTGKLAAAEKALADANARHAEEKAGLQKQVDDALAEAVEQEDKVRKLEADAKAADVKAAEMVAALGVPPVKADNAGDAAAHEETLEQVRAQLAKEKDPLKAGALAAKAAKLRAEAE
jgi:colicin import membrane protein